jgi:hypothetical protein
MNLRCHVVKDQIHRAINGSRRTATHQSWCPPVFDFKERPMSVSSAQPIREVDRRDDPAHRADEGGAIEGVKVLNLAEAAALVRCSRAHLSNVVNGKVHGIPRLPTVRIGRRVLFRRESLEQWLQQVESMTALQPSR